MNKEDCTICNLALGRAEFTVYEDDMMKAVLHDKPSTPGQVLLFPKKHYTILEQVPDDELEKLFVMANKISTSVFESLGMHGTNILVNNGVAAGQMYAHFTIQIIPRMENDGLNLEWKTKQLSEEEMSTVELILKPLAENPFAKKEEAKPIVQEEARHKLPDDSQNYLVRQLRRIP
ncbi:MAG: HIT domain-containing protein [Candidatus Woesearchaeota archaeon]